MRFFIQEKKTKIWFNRLNFLLKNKKYFKYFSCEIFHPRGEKSKFGSIEKVSVEK